MNCPNCKAEMTKGMLVSQGSQWIPLNRKRGNWMDKLSMIGSALPVVAWRCPSCNKIELNVEVK